MLRFVTVPYLPLLAQNNIQAALIIVLTPSRIAQYLYDQSRMLAETRFGWLALAGTMGVVFSFNTIH
jgi:hypothetical protein